MTTNNDQDRQAPIAGPPTDPAPGVDGGSPASSRHSNATRAELDDAANRAVIEVWGRYQAGLPGVAAATWRIGAVYVRDSDVASLTGDSVTNQCESALRLMTDEQIYVPRENVFFEQATGTTLAARARFRELLAQARAGNFVALAAYMSSRLFRNMEDAIAIKREFRLQGIDLFWVGRPKMDDRTPMAWQTERNTEMYDELHSRQTGWYVGMQKEYLASQGYPQGPLPEGYVAVEWGPSVRGGRPGRAIGWAFSEPLASHIKEGAKRYLAGASFKDLSTWSMGSDFKGFTPKGRPMGESWWYQSLMNPKYSGLHFPSVYTGYKPGVESPKRAVRKRDSALIPCRLPVLIPVEDHDRIIEVSASRRKGPNLRPSHTVDLTSGILYDADCGHRLYNKQRTHRGRELLRVKCFKTQKHGEEQPSFYAHDSVAELDALLGGLRFRDVELLGRIAQQLDEAEASVETVRVKSDPRVAELKSAIASLASDSFAAARQPLIAQLEMLEREASRVVPRARPCRAAVEDLEHWAHIWDTATSREKNALLRAAGVRVHISRKPIASGSKDYKRSSALVELRVADPVFAAVLAIALGDRVDVRPDIDIDDVANLWRSADWIDIDSSDVQRPTVVLRADLWRSIDAICVNDRLDRVA